MVETVLMITLAAVVIPPLLMLFAETVISGANAHIQPTANLLANQLMEEIRARRFDEQSEKSGSGNWSTVLVPDAGEADKPAFDDVDDFNGWAQNFGPTFPDYEASVTVEYVASNDLNTAMTIPDPVPNNWTPSYKRIRVTVNNVGLPAGIALTTLVTEMQSL